MEVDWFNCQVLHWLSPRRLNKYLLGSGHPKLYHPRNVFNMYWARDIHNWTAPYSVERREAEWIFIGLGASTTEPPIFNIYHPRNVFNMYRTRDIHNWTAPYSVEHWEAEWIFIGLGASTTEPPVFNIYHPWNVFNMYRTWDIHNWTAPYSVERQEAEWIFIRLATHMAWPGIPVCRASVHKKVKPIQEIRRGPIGSWPLQPDHCGRVITNHCEADRFLCDLEFTTTLVWSCIRLLPFSMPVDTPSADRKPSYLPENSLAIRLSWIEFNVKYEMQTLLRCEVYPKPLPKTTITIIGSHIPHYPLSVSSQRMA